MGCKCCRWPVNACRMARVVRLLPLSFGGLVLFLAVHSFCNYSIVTGALLLILGLTPPRRKPLKLPPGPSGLPVVGYLPFLGELPHQHMAILARKFGPLVHLQLGSLPGFVVASARLAKEVLMTQDRVFASRPESFVTWANLSTYYNKDSGIQNSMSTARPGPFLTEMQSPVEVELMVPKKECFMSIRSEEMDAMVQGLLEDVKLGKQAADLDMTIGAAIVNVIARMVVQKRYYAKDISAETKKEASEFQTLLGAVLSWAGHPFPQDSIPWLRPVMSLISSNKREMAKLAKRTDEFFETMLKEHRQRPNTVEPSRDSVEVMLQSVIDDGKRLDDKAIKAVTLEMFMAGAEPTALTTESALAEPLHPPAIQKKLQAELDAVIGTARMAQEGDLGNLTYLDAVMKETIRLHLAMPLMIPHSNSQPTQMDGHDIHAHPHVFVNVWAMGRDPPHWHHAPSSTPLLEIALKIN